MRRVVHTVCVVSAVTACFLSGCGGGDGNTGSPAYTPDVDPGSVDPTCCGVTYEEIISGTSPAGGAYYWLALIDADTVVLYGLPVYIPEGSYESVSLTVTANYLDGISAGLYRREVYVSAELEGVGDTKTRAAAVCGGISEVVSYTDSVCTTCCTNEDNGGLRRYYCWATKPIGDVVGALANIRTRYGHLCGDLDETAQMGAWVGIQDDLPPATLTDFCQVGYMIRRYPGGFVDTIVYLECSYTSGVALRWSPEHHDPNNTEYLPLPENGSEHLYECRIDPIQCIVQFKFDGVPIKHISDSMWLDRTVMYASWKTEIDGRETDMPGTESDPCVFSGCRYRLHDGYDPWSAAFTQNDYIGVTPQAGARSDEWGIWVDTGGSTMKTWDVHPLGE